jgi:hypothetical protein
MAWKRNPRTNNKSKYGACKAEIRQSDGSVIRFDSKKEAKRFIELRWMEQAGKIRDLQRQVKYVLIPAQRMPDTVGKRGGKIKGKLLERECSYVADFVYEDAETGETIVEDTKGMRTTDYIIKRKLMLWVHNIRIREV